MHHSNCTPHIQLISFHSVFALVFAYKHNTLTTTVFHKSSLVICFIHASVYYYKFIQVYAFMFIFISTRHVKCQRVNCVLRKIHVNVVFFPWIDELIFSFALVSWRMTENDVFYNCFHSLDLQSANNVISKVRKTFFEACMCMIL